MKRCPACQRTYPDDSMTFCLDDGTPLLNVEPGTFDAPPTLRIPEPRVTEQPAQPYATPPMPPYTQPSGAGFKLTNKVLGISGASLLILGVFMPIISVLGLVTFSLFTFIQGGFPTGPTARSAGMAGDFVDAIMIFRIFGIVILLLGVGALLLALKNRLKPLLAIGIAMLAALVFIFIKLQMLLSTAPAEARAFIGIGWGFFAMVAAAVILIVAGVRKEKNLPSSAGWSSNPPPTNYP
ncbi:MAG TPA: hypothetical protein VKB86_04110 [Pyrinomonadaceae bacterium]|nr:hypothetical protein [Pyrinomonadaceae bacterium]